MRRPVGHADDMMRQALLTFFILALGCDEAAMTMEGSDADAPDEDAGVIRLYDAGEGGSMDAGESPGGDAGAPSDDGGAPTDDAGPAPDPDAGAPMAWVFEEVGGLVAFEAEHFVTNDDQGTPRAWYLTAAGMIPGVTPDPDEPHHESASGGVYLEGLPDTRVTHDDPLRNGESFFNNGGEGPMLTYRVVFTTPGRYYVHARAYSTGTEDNGVHVGIDGTWPDSGRRIQWCSGKNRWTWSSAQRDSGGSACGVEHTIWIEVPTAGEHEIHFSMREDGFELDKLILTTDDAYDPDGAGPDERLYTP